MNLFHITNYKLYKENIKNNLKICLISDLHYSFATSDDKMKRIVAKLSEINPNYIMFSGDLIDSVNVLKDKAKKNKLIFWLQEIASINPMLISLGSHDYCKKVIYEDKKKFPWIEDYPSDFFELLNSLKNISILNNTSFEDDNLFVTGYTQGMLYFNTISKIRKSILHPSTENKEEMLKELKKLRNIIKEIPSDKLKFLLVHSPIFLNDSDILKYIDDYDYFISGHMHNGCVPPILYEIWNSSRGLISPTKKLFADNERNTLKFKNDKLIVNGPLTMFHENKGLIEKFNVFYPNYMNVLEFTNNTEYNTEKVYTKRMYTK